MRISAAYKSASWHFHTKRMLFKELVALLQFKKNTVKQLKGIAGCWQPKKHKQLTCFFLQWFAELLADIFEGVLLIKLLNLSHMLKEKNELLEKLLQ
jgi:hypothetical protein